MTYKYSLEDGTLKKGFSSEQEYFHNPGQQQMDLIALLELAVCGNNRELSESQMNVIKKAFGALYSPNITPDTVAWYRKRFLEEELDMFVPIRDTESPLNA